MQQDTPATSPGILVGKDGPQIINSTGKRWSEAAEERHPKPRSPAPSSPSIPPQATAPAA